MSYANRAPRYLTIVIALVLVVIGWLCTFGPVDAERVGVLALVAATVLMILGVFVRGL